MSAKHSGHINRGAFMSMAVFYMLLLIVSFLFPYTGDDWAWGSSIGLDRLSSHFANYNGRYIGNLLVLALTRSIILRSIVVSATLFLIVWYIHKIIGRVDYSVFWLAASLILAVPLKIRSQGIAWVSGFTNYAIPSLLILIYIDSYKYVFEPTYIVDNAPIKLFKVFFLGFANSLIMENITVLNVIVSFVLLLYTRVKHKTWDISQLCFLIGSVFGAVCMFTNGAYHKILTSEDSYRSIATKQEDSLLINIIKKYLRVIAGVFILNNSVLNLFLAIISLVAIKHGHHSKLVRVGLFLLVVTGLLTAGSVRYPFSFPSEGIYPHTILIAITEFYGFVSIIMLLAMFLSSFSGTRPLFGLFIVCVLIVMVAPLLVVNPIGPRNFLPSYCLLVLLACHIYNSLFADSSIEISKLFKYLTLVVLFTWYRFYIPVAVVEHQREAFVKEAIRNSSSEVTVPNLPYSEFIHCSNPSNEPWITRYKLFHGLNDAVTLKCE